MSDEPGMVAAVSRNDAYTFTKPNRDEIVLVAGLGVEGDIHAGVNVRHRSRVAADPSQPNLRQVHLIQSELFDEVAGKGYEVPAGGLGENVTTRGIDLLALPRGTVLRFGSLDSAPDADGGGAAGAGPEADSDSPGQTVGEQGEQGEQGGHGGRGAEGEQGGHGDPGEQGGRGAEGGRGEQGEQSGHGDQGEQSRGGPVGAVLEAAAAAVLDEPTARAAAAVAAAVGRDSGSDVRPAVIVAGLRNPCGQINGFRPGLLKEVLGRDDDGNLVRRAGVMGVVLRGGTVRPGDPVVVELPPGAHGPLERV